MRSLVDLNLHNMGSPSVRETVNNPDFTADGNVSSEATASGQRCS